jgi:hypothetical protein
MTTQENETLSKKVEELAMMLSSLHDNIKVKELELKTLKDEYNNIKTKELATLMENEGYAVGSKLILKNGKIIIVKDFFTASIPSITKITSERNPMKQEEMSQMRTQCMQWLNENDLKEIIKNKIVINLDKGDNEKAQEILSFLEDKKVSAKQEETVHPSTLKAVLKELIQSGKDIPFDLFNITSGIFIDIK